MSCSRICSCVADTPLAVKLNCVKRLNYATALRREGVGASLAELC